jgi:Fic family protein
MKSEIQKQNEIKAKKVKAVATKEQMKVFNDMQSGTEYLFLMYLGKEPITVESIDHTLMIMVNSVEGDISQLEDEHVKYARKKGWLKVFEQE